MAEQGAKIAATMVQRCHELDPTRVVSAAVNGDNQKGVSDALDIIGFNYNLKFPDDLSQAASHRPVYGSETASTISTRGVYQTDPLRNTLSAYDVNHTEWSELAEEWWKFYGTREWLAGGFAWTGFDYRGEPTPYGWPSINSQLRHRGHVRISQGQLFLLQGVVDEAARAAPVPALELGGQGRRRDSRVGALEPRRSGVAAERQEPGRQKVPRLGHVEWKVRYEPGTITAHGWKDGKLALTEERRPPDPP